MKTNIKFKLGLGFLALATIIMLQSASFSFSAGEMFASKPKTLIVPDAFSTISSAIENALPGDEVFVKSGTYFENPVINKAISVIGEDHSATFVVGSGGADRGAKAVFNITSDNVILSGFTVQSRNYTNSGLTASGINVAGDFCKIKNNVIFGTYYGIFSSIQSDLTIAQNNITSTLKDGIRICGGSNNSITENTISKNAQSGIALDGYADTVKFNRIQENYRGLGLGAAYSLVFANNFVRNTESGLYVASSDSTIAANNITQSKWGIHFTSFFAAPNNNTFYLNNVVDNTNAVGTSSTFNRQHWSFEKAGNYWGNLSERGSHLVYDGNLDNNPLAQPYVLIQDFSEPAKPILPTPVNGTVAVWHFDEVNPNGATPDSVGDNTVVLEPTGNTFTPILTNGKVGKALQFNGTDYAYVTTSPTLNIKTEMTIDAWINVQELKENVDYNNIFIECTRTPDKFPTRILGFSINGLSPQNENDPPLRALRGFMLDEKGVFNEIVTQEAVVPLNQWIHVTFVRSLTTGMHIYVDGQEKTVKVTSGSQKPIEAPAKGTEFYIGHDSLATIDELTVSTVAISQDEGMSSPSFVWWLGIVIVAGIMVSVGVVLLIRRK